MKQGTNIKTLARLVTVGVLAGLLGFFQESPAEAGLITFNEVADPTAVGTGAAAVTIGNVTFSYEGYSLYFADIGDLGPEIGNPVLLGETFGVLNLYFAIPVQSFSFDFALDAVSDVEFGVSAELIPPGQDLGDIFEASAFYDDTVGLALGSFSYSGLAIQQANLFFDMDNSFAFTLDNVASAPVPEPATLLLFSLGAAGLALTRIRNNKV